jgi:hypothetical protein
MRKHFELGADDRLFEGTGGGPKATENIWYASSMG